MKRVLILAVSLVAAAYALRLLVWQPYVCNIEKRYYDERTAVAASQTSVSYGFSSPVARTNIVALERLSRRCPMDLDVLMLLAANHLLLQQRGEAIVYYERALRVSRRPEIYQLLGEAQAAAGRPRDAIRNLEMAERADPFYRNTAADRAVLQLQLGEASVR